MMGCAMGTWCGRSCVVDGGGAWGAVSSRCDGAFVACSPALMVAKTSWSVGEVGGCGDGSLQVRW